MRRSAGALARSRSPGPGRKKTSLRGRTEVKWDAHEVPPHPGGPGPNRPRPCNTSGPRPGTASSAHGLEGREPIPRPSECLARSTEMRYTLGGEETSHATDPAVPARWPRDTAVGLARSEGNRSRVQSHATACHPRLRPARPTCHRGDRRPGSPGPALGPHAGTGPVGERGHLRSCGVRADRQLRPVGRGGHPGRPPRRPGRPRQADRPRPRVRPRRSQARGRRTMARRHARGLIQGHRRPGHGDDRRG